VVDALARAKGYRYTSHDVVGAGPRVVAGTILMQNIDVDLKAYEIVMDNPSIMLRKDIVLVSIMSSDEGALKRIIRVLEKNGFKGILIVGGPASFDYIGLMNRHPRIDYIIVGEAEIPLMKIFRDVDKLFSGDIRDIPALAYREDGYVRITTNHIHTPAEIISSIKPWTLIEKSYPSYRVMRYYVEVLRGCSNFHRPLITGIPGLGCINCGKCYSPNYVERTYCPVNIPPGCGFCSVPYMFGAPRSRDVDSIVEEVRELIQHGAGRIVLSAPDFLDYGRDWVVKPKPLTDPCYPEANIDAIDQLLSQINTLEKVRSGMVVVMIENIKACLVDEKVAQVLGKYLHGTTIHIGVETGDDLINEKMIGKPIKIEHVVKAVKLLKLSGLRPYIYLMYGLPFMNRESYIKTIELIDELNRLGVEKITLYKYMRLKGTAFENLEYDDRGREDLVLKLKRRVEEVNLENKKALMGKLIEVYLTYSNGRYYGYPVKHGPVVFVKGLRNPKYSGCKALVSINGLSSRYVYGVFEKIISC